MLLNFITLVVYILLSLTGALTAVTNIDLLELLAFGLLGLLTFVFVAIEVTARTLAMLAPWACHTVMKSYKGYGREITYIELLRAIRSPP